MQNLHYMSIPLNQAQADIVNAYQGGYLQVMAVPGSGKTHMLTVLATRLIVERIDPSRQQILLVTFTRSGVANIRQRLSEFLAQCGRPVSQGYLVTTLHGLAGMINQQPVEEGTWESRAEIQTQQAISHALTTCQIPPSHPDYMELKGLLAFFVRLCKHHFITPDVAKMQFERINATLMTSTLWESIQKHLDLCCQGYQHYEEYMRTIGGLDFDDILLRALQMLRTDPDLYRYYSSRWAYILEDEAQDSSPLQVAILQALTSQHKNWVRVGDPNQSIMDSFTVADRTAFSQPSAQWAVRFLQASRRHTEPVAVFANHFVQAVNESVADDSKPFIEMNIQVTDNASSHKPRLHIVGSALDMPVYVAGWLEKQFLARPDRSYAVLLPDRFQGDKYYQALMTRPALRGHIQSFFRETNELGQFVQFLKQAYIAQYAPLERRWKSAVEHICHYVGFHQADATILSDAQEVASLSKTVKKFADYPLMSPRLLQQHQGFQRFVASISPAARNMLDKCSAYFEYANQIRHLLPHQFIEALSYAYAGESSAKIGLGMALAERLYHALYRRPRRTTSVIDVFDELSAQDLDAFIETRSESLSHPQKGMITLTTVHSAKGLEWDHVCFPDLQARYYPWNAQEGRGFFAFKNRTVSRNALLKSFVQVCANEEISDAMMADHHNAAELLDSLHESIHKEVIYERWRLLYVGVTRTAGELDLFCALPMAKTERVAQDGQYPTYPLCLMTLKHPEDFDIIPLPPLSLEYYTQHCMARYNAENGASHPIQDFYVM